MKNGAKIEISPQSLLIANSLGELISKINGGALFIDYGESNFFSDSIRVL